MQNRQCQGFTKKAQVDNISGLFSKTLSLPIQNTH